MKTIFYIVTFAFAVVSVWGETGTISAVVQEGLFEEEVNRDFGAAIVAYESAIKRFDEDRQAAATAMFRLAEIYSRSERTAEAEVLYERVVREFYDQRELVELAAERLPEGKAGAGETALVGPEAEAIEELKRILRDSPDLFYSRNRQNNNNTRLHDAIEKGQLRVAEFLIEHGLDVNAENVRGSTPLHLAVEEGSKIAVNFLLENGADVGRMNNQGETALHVAAKRGYLAIAEILLENSADVNVSLSEGWTPLHASVSENHIRLAQLLIANGADVDAVDELGLTPLHMAVKNHEIRMVEILLQSGAYVNALHMQGGSPLDYSIAIDATKISEILLQHGAKEGKYYTRVVGMGEEERYILWDRSETMTLSQVLADIEIDLGKLKSISIGNSFHSKLDLKRYPPIRPSRILMPLSAESEDMKIQTSTEILLE